MTNTEQTTDNKAELTEYINTLDIDYTASFVPFSQSRNAKEKNPSLNWKVQIKKGKQSMTTDYMQGIGHLPNYCHQFSKIEAIERAVSDACETGKSSIIKYKNAYDAAHAGRSAPPARLIPEPGILDVLYSLVLDSSVLDYGTFEEWAGDYGYDTDSRNAERIYKECISIALKMRDMIGDDAVSKLRELFQDY